MKQLILISGKRSSGKSYVSEKISKKFGYTHFEMSKIAKELRAYDNKTQFHLRKYVSKKHKKNGKSFLMCHLLKKIALSSEKKIIVSGIRHIEEVKCIPKEVFEVKWYYIYDTFISRLVKVINRKDRSSIIEFFIEEYYSNKWGDYILRKNSVLIDKRIGIKALLQIETLLKVDK